MATYSQSAFESIEEAHNQTGDFLATVAAAQEWSAPMFDLAMAMANASYAVWSVSVSAFLSILQTSWLSAVPAATAYDLLTSGDRVQAARAAGYFGMLAQLVKLSGVDALSKVGDTWEQGQQAAESVLEAEQLSTLSSIVADGAPAVLADLADFLAAVGQGELPSAKQFGGVYAFGAAFVAFLALLGVIASRR